MIKNNNIGRPKIYDEGAKQHNINNKYSTDYYRTHKDEKINCPSCNQLINKFSKSQHMTTQKCALNSMKWTVK